MPDGTDKYFCVLDSNNHLEPQSFSSLFAVATTKKLDSELCFGLFLFIFFLHFHKIIKVVYNGEI